MLTKRLSRRDLGLGVAAFTLTACVKTGTTAQAQDAAPHKAMEKIMSETDWANLSEADWKERLTTMEFSVLRREATERPGSSPLNREKRKGTFVCAGCELPLFTSEQKYESGTGWPSFTQPIKENAIKYEKDVSFGMVRVEVMCNTCDAHLGHVFPDGPEPSGLRYCINSESMVLEKEEVA